MAYLNRKEKRMKNVKLIVIKQNEEGENNILFSM